MRNDNLYPLMIALSAAVTTHIPTVLAHSGEMGLVTEELIVRASPLAKSLSDNLHPVSVLNGDTLLQQAAATLGATLEGRVGVSSASFGPGVGSPIIRGQGANRVKVMQDNLDTLDAANASADHANSVEPLLAESIEILRGPQTLRFGSGAIGGVVNIIDSRVPMRRANTPISGAIETRHSSGNDETATVMRLDGGAGEFAWHLDGLYRDSNNADIPSFADIHGDTDDTQGYIANTDNQSQGGSLGGSWITDQGYVGLSVNYNESHYGIPSGSHEHEEETNIEEHAVDAVRIAMRQSRYDLKAERLEPFAGFSTAWVRLAYVDYQHTELENGNAGTRFTSQATEGRFELVHEPLTGFWQDWQGVMGVQWLNRDFAAIGDEAFIPASTIQGAGLFLIEAKDFDNWSIELGARIDRQTIDPEGLTSHTTHTSSLSTAGQYQVSSSQRLKLSLSRAQRAPSIEELYSDGAHVATSSFDQGDASLNPETSVNWELGYYYGDAVNSSPQLSISVFYNHINNFIYQRNTGIIDSATALSIYQYHQQTAVFKGLEAELTVPLTQVWALRLFADTVRATLDSGDDVPRTPPTRIGSELHYTADVWEASLQAIHGFRQTHAGDFEDPTASWTRLDAHLTWHWDETTLFIKVDNLLDNEIRNASSYLRDVAPEPGRSLTAGLRYLF